MADMWVVVHNGRAESAWSTEHDARTACEFGQTVQTIDYCGATLKRAARYVVRVSARPDSRTGMG